MLRVIRPLRSVKHLPRGLPRMHEVQARHWSLPLPEATAVALLSSALTASGGIAWRYLVSRHTLRRKCKAALEMRFESEKKPGDMRPIIEEKAEVLREYVLGFDKKKEGSFYVVLGPQASGKTSVIKQAFDGWQGVCLFEVTLDPESVANIRFQEVLSGRFAFLKENTSDLACRESVEAIDAICREEKGHPLVVIINLKSGGKPVSEKQAAIIAGKMLDFARTYTYDQPTCPIIIETSIPMIGDKLTSRYGGICKALYMPPMNLSGFKDVALEWIAKEGTWKRLKVTEKCTTPEEALKELKACMEDPTGKGKEVNDLLEEYYLKVGPNVRKLQGLIAGKGEEQTFAEKIEIAHDDLKKSLKSLTDDEKPLVRKLVAAGPTGYGARGDDVDSKETLLARPTTATLARKIHDCITLHYVGHVYALLMQEHKDDATVRALMKQYGWVDMTEPVQASSA